jgi:L-ascorbate metabolism protein UlaG (beta-lactamase superfamily)
MPVRRYRSLVSHWVGGWFRAPRAVAHDPAPAPGPDEVAITFGGHATVAARYRDPALAIVFDPMFGSWIGGVRRAVAPGLAAGDLADVGLILISHRHADHLHAPSLAQLPRSATVIVPTGAAAWISPLGFARVIELAPGADYETSGVQIIATPVAHGEAELARGLAYVVRGHGPTLYLCGDSGYFSGFADVGARFAPDVAVLPIGGFVPASFRARHMSPLDALYAFEDLRAQALVPIHHGAFALSYEQLGEPARWLAELATARGVREAVHVLAPGQSMIQSAAHGARRLDRHPHL